MNHFSFGWPCSPLDPGCHFDMFCKCVKHTCWQKVMLGHAGGGGVLRGAHPKIYYKAFNETCYKLIFLSKINSTCTVTLDPFVGIVKCLCGRQTCTTILQKKVVGLPLEIVWKCARWDKVEDGVGGKAIGFLLVECINFDQTIFFQ